MSRTAHDEGRPATRRRVAITILGLGLAAGAYGLTSSLANAQTTTPTNPTTPPTTQAPSTTQPPHRDHNCPHDRGSNGDNNGGSNQGTDNTDLSLQ